MSSPPRAWRALCPNCGAPVEFQSAASPMAVCGFCRSTLVREGEALRRIGQSAELFDDHTPLQLGAAGSWQGAGFVLVGRLQLRYAQGTWNEWHALFDNGRSGWLSEDNGAYVLGFDGPPSDDLPQPAQLQVGLNVTAGQRRWSVASVTAVRANAVEGELPRVPQMERGWVVADLRNEAGEVATLEADQPPTVHWTIGRAVPLAELKLTGLKTESAASMKGRSLECPSCGAALEPKLDSTKSLTCGQCRAVVDISGGLGADLDFYRQDNALPPLIPLGRVGKIALGGAEPLSWQVVGYVEWCEDGAGADADDDKEFWREYLLYHRTAGFGFLVDANDGWSWSRPITGVPKVIGSQVRHQGADYRAERLEYQGQTYRRLYAYGGRITYVLGEFYWQLKRGQTTWNVDYAGEGGRRGSRMYREQSGQGDAREVVWSTGGTPDGKAVALAFRIDPKESLSFRRDVNPLAGGIGQILSGDGEGLNWGKVWNISFILVLIVFFVLIAVFDREDDCEDTRSTFGENSNEYRECQRNNYGGGSSGHGGSWGGYSSGGSHK